MPGQSNQTGSDRAATESNRENDVLYVTVDDFDHDQVVPFGTIGEIVDVRTYRRWLPNEKRRETAIERWVRVINYNLSLVSDRLSYDELRQEGLLMADKFSRLLADASGRTKWVGGTDAAKNNPSSQFNCSFLVVNRLSAFSEAFDLLMLGTGVGYRVFEKDVNALPAIVSRPEIHFFDYHAVPKNQREEDTTYLEYKHTPGRLYVDAGDSRQGWIDAAMAYLNAVTNPVAPYTELYFDLDYVRPAGERLNGFGGTASGPEALKGIISDIHRIITECPGDRIRSIDAMDIMCAIAKGVVAGSSRRSAMICLFQQGDELCATAKVGLYTNPDLAHKSYRSQSNNTACLSEKPTLEEIKQLLDTCRTEGEPGFNNYSEMIRRRTIAAQTWRADEPNKYIDVGTNPCFAAGTMVLTRDGHYPIEELVGKVVEVWDGERWVKIDNFRVTGYDQDVFTVTLHSGQTVTATPYHKFILEDGTVKELRHLIKGDRLLTHDINVDELVNPVVESVEFSHVADEVYCCTVPTNHRFSLSNSLIVGQCHEIILSAGLDGKSGSFCNLTTLPLPNFVKNGKLDMRELESSIRLNTRISLRQTCVDIPMKGWDATQKDERLLGVSVTGWQDAFSLLGWKTGSAEIDSLLRTMNMWANQEATAYSDTLGVPRPLLVTCVKPEGCLDVEAVRVLDNGLLTIDEVNPLVNEELGFSHVEGFSCNNNRVPHTYNNGYAKVRRIRLKNGRILNATPNHQFSVKGKWIRSDKIKPGTVIDYQLGTYSNKVDAILLLPDMKQFADNVNFYRLPERINPDLAWLIGHYLANGCYTTNDRIKLHHQYIDCHKKAQRIWLEQFGVQTVVYPYPDRDSYGQDFRSTLIRSWLALNGLDKISHECFPRIPLKIRQSSVESVIAFIAGYADSDGCFYSRTFCIDSKWEIFVRHIQQVGEAVGLCFSTIENSQRKGSHTDGTSMWKNHLSRTYSLGWAIDLINKHSVKAVQKPVEASNNKHKAPHPYAVVSNVELDDSIPTYDIEVENEPWYYTGGILSHNTASQVYGVSNGLHWDWAPFYIRRVQMSAKDALAQTLIDQGFPAYPTPYDLGVLLPEGDVWEKITKFDSLDRREQLELLNKSSAVIFEFPVKSYSDRTQSEVGAIEQLENLKVFTKLYCDHMPSVTISVKDHEWDDVANWVDQNWDSFITASFFPYFDAKYPLLPYEAIAESQYHERLEAISERWRVTLPNGRNRFVIDELWLNKYEWSIDDNPDDEEISSDCSTGACPVR